MERRRDHDLDRIRQSLLRMRGLVEEMVARATRPCLAVEVEPAEVAGRVVEIAV